MLRVYHFAIALVFLTIGLILVGGIVHSTGSSLACPDWPLCFGKFFPKMEGNVFWEHGHRLVALFIIVLTVLLCILLCIKAKREQNNKFAALGIFALCIVGLQALWGGLTVLYGLPILISTAHLMTSMLFLAILTYTTWQSRVTAAPVLLPQKARCVIGIITILLYVQIVLGALVRHTGSGLACTDFPFCQGQLIPLHEGPTLVIHALHRLLAVFLTLVLVGTVPYLLQQTRGYFLARGFVFALPLLISAQMALGILSVLSSLNLFLVTAHLGIAALLLCSLVSLFSMSKNQ